VVLWLFPYRANITKIKTFNPYLRCQAQFLHRQTFCIKPVQIQLLPTPFLRHLKHRIWGLKYRLCTGDFSQASSLEWFHHAKTRENSHLQITQFMADSTTEIILKKERKLHLWCYIFQFALLQVGALFCPLSVKLVNVESDKSIRVRRVDLCPS